MIFEASAWTVVHDRQVAFTPAETRHEKSMRLGARIGVISTQSSAAQGPSTSTLRVKDGETMPI